MRLLSGSLTGVVKKRVKAIAISFFSASGQNPIKTISALLMLAALFSGACQASGGALSALPRELTATDQGEAYRLTYTGRAQRVFLFFKVYEIAHYIAQDVPVEDARGASEAPTLSPETVVDDERGKAIFIRFNRTLRRERIRNEFALSILKNAQADWLVQAQSSIDAFMDAIDRDAKADDQLVFFWLPGGRLLVEFNDEQAFEATDMAFAKLIWSIWFGAEPVCDPKELLAQIAPQGAA